MAGFSSKSAGPAATASGPSAGGKASVEVVSADASLAAFVSRRVVRFVVVVSVEQEAKSVTASRAAVIFVIILVKTW